MSLWHGRASKVVGTAAIALAVLVGSGSLAFARGGYGGGHHGGGYSHGGSYHHFGTSYNRGYGGYNSFPRAGLGGYGYASPYYGYTNPYYNTSGYGYPGYGYGTSGFATPNVYSSPGFGTWGAGGYCR